MVTGHMTPGNGIEDKTPRQSRTTIKQVDKEIFHL